MSALNEVKIAFARYMGDWYRQIQPNTKALREYAQRGLKTSVAMAPGRMIDQAQDLINEWRKQDNTGATGPSAFLPMTIIAVAKDFSVTGGDFSNHIADEVPFVYPGDPHGRVFHVRAAAVDVRAQVAFFAADEPTARSMAMQFVLFASSPSRRRFWAEYTFAGIKDKWPVTIETTDYQIPTGETGQKNLTALIVDVGLRPTVPLFHAPGDGDPNDGLGAGGPDDPHGYPTVQQVRATNETTLNHTIVTADPPNPPIVDRGPGRAPEGP